MKTIGLIKEMDADIVQKKYLEIKGEFLNSPLINKTERERIINYLNNSEMVFSITLALFDEGNYIAPYMLFSDGEWIWASHFSYFLNKSDFSYLSDDFLNHIRTKEYKIAKLTKQQIREILIFIDEELLNTRGSKLKA